MDTLSDLSAALKTTSSPDTEPNDGGLGLPPEILTEIMLDCAISAFGLPVLLNDLSLVCKAWHNVIISTPLFWNRIDTSPLYSKSASNVLAFLRASLSRSGALPLFLTVHYIYEPEDEAEFIQLFNLVHQMADRVESLSLRSFPSAPSMWKVLSGSGISRAEGEPPIRWASLQKLSIHAYTPIFRKRGTGQSDLTPLLFDFPHLKSVEMNIPEGIAGFHYNQLTSLPLAQLESISFHYMDMSYQDYRDFLMACGNLLHCDYYSLCGARRCATPAPCANVTLPLTHLRLAGMSSFNIAITIMSNISLPRLNSLYLSFNELFHKPPSILFLKDKIIEWGCAITELGLDTADAPNDDVLSLLGTVPQLAKLYLGDHNATPEFINALNEKKLIPCLKHIEIKGPLVTMGSDEEGGMHYYPIRDTVISTEQESERAFQDFAASRGYGSKEGPYLTDGWSSRLYTAEINIESG